MSVNTQVLLPPIGNKCRQFCTSLVQNLYYVSDSYLRSEGVLDLGTRFDYCRNVSRISTRILTNMA
jgi:hypothetical protein